MESWSRIMTSRAVVRMTRSRACSQKTQCWPAAAGRRGGRGAWRWLRNGRARRGRRARDGGAEVEALVEVVDDAAAGELTRRPDDGGDADDGVVHAPLLAQGVVAETVAVVGSEDDDGVVEVAGFAEGIENLADLLVDHGDVGEVEGALAVALLGGGAGVEGEGIDKDLLHTVT